MKKIMLVAMVALLAIPATSSAFDGLRKGFVLGGGLGFAPYVKFAIKDTPFDHSKAGIGGSLFLGYAWDEMNMIVWEANVGSYSENSVSVAQGYSGPVWYHYFGPVGKSFFTAAGLGFYYFRIEGASADPGFGLMGGAGYEFVRHVQASFFVSIGQTNDPDFSAIDYTHTTINMLIQAAAF